MSIDSRQIGTLVATLLEGPDRFDSSAKRLMNMAGVDMTVLEKGIVHVLTGLLRASIHPEGPFEVADGTLVEVISPMPAAYGAFEAARGGEHDFPALTLEQGQQIIAELARAMGDAFAEAYIQRERL